jgi:hypothetical protein
MIKERNKVRDKYVIKVRDTRAIKDRDRREQGKK